MNDKKQAYLDSLTEQSFGKAASGPKPRKPLPPMSEKKKKALPAQAKVREAVFERDGRQCFFVRNPQHKDVAGGCFGPLTFGHLKKAGQGGIYTADNGETLCAWHNDWCEIEPDEAAKLGLVIRKKAVK